MINNKEFVVKFQINDEDGFIFIVNNQKYQSFVDEDWQFDPLMQHFIQQMNQQSLIIWQTNDSGGGGWNIEVIQEPYHDDNLTKFSHDIQVTNGQLFLSIYTDLTMAAQFEDERIPSKDNADLIIPLTDGFYTITVCKLFTDDASGDDSSTIHFRIFIESRLLERHAQIYQILWMQPY